MLIKFISFMLFTALILAWWEIQIEGKDGWAAKSPGWRIEKGFLMKLTGGLPITGYHFFMQIFLLSMLHLPLFFIQWSWRLESLLLGFYVGMLMIEDFLWFVFNPYYGIKNFQKNKIWWHKRWLGPVPTIYWIMTLITLGLIFLGREALGI